MNFRAIVLLTLALLSCPCYPSTGPQRLVLFVDVSTPLDPSDQRVLQEGTTRLFNSMLPGDSLLIFSIADQPANSRLLFDERIPGCVDRGIFTGCNLNDAQRQRRNLLTQKLIPRIADIVSSTRALPRSAIVETITETILANGHFDYLLVWSDGFQNTAGCDFRDPTNNACAYQKRLASERMLRNTRVTFFGLGRNDAQPRRVLSQSERQQLDDFWTSFLTSAGARRIALRTNLGTLDTPRGQSDVLQ